MVSGADAIKDPQWRRPRASALPCFLRGPGESYSEVILRVVVDHEELR